MKALVQGAYDIQKLRVQMGNRICQCWYQSHGVDPGTKPDDALDAEKQKLLKRIKDEYHGLASGIRRLRDKEKFQASEYLPEYVVVQLCAMHDGLEEQEAFAFKDIGIALAGIPVWEHYLKSVTGCGPAMAGVLISKLDVIRAERPSQFWAFAGLDVAADGRARSRRKEHLVKRAYTSHEGKAEERLSITYDPFLRTKLFVLARQFMMNNNVYYKGIYENYKHRLEHRPDWAERTKGHRHNAARRYMVKMFLADLWRAWREIEGLPVVETYAIDKLHLHHRPAAE
jgi:hypothetical protein